jgi:hypothetical protein
MDPGDWTVIDIESGKTLGPLSDEEFEKLKAARPDIKSIELRRPGDVWKELR